MTDSRQSPLPTARPRLFLPRAGEWAVPLVYLLVGVIAYGLLIPGLGFFWDDWPNAWFLHVFGPEGFPRAFASDRPVIGYLYLLTTPLVGESPTAWHLFALLWRIAAGLALWQVIRLGLPRLRTQAAWVGLLFLVYPSFQQQYVSIIYSHFFLLLTLHLASISLTLIECHGPTRKRALAIGALVAQAVSMFAVEYFVHLEVLRAALLWGRYARKTDGSRGRGKAFLRSWSPYLVLTVLYLIWRTAGLGFSTYPPRLIEAWQSDPAAALTGLARVVPADLADVLQGAWSAAAIPPDPARFGLRATAFVGLAGVVCLALVGWFALSYRSRSGEGTPVGNQTGGRLGGALLGLALMLAGGAAAWITALPVGLVFPWDRLTLPLLVGACLVIVGVISLLSRPRWLSSMVFAVLTALAVTAQLRAGFAFRRDWEAQRDFFWQLAWRAPAIDPGTLLLTNDIPFTFETDNSLTGPVNWIYAASPPDPDMDYLLYFVSLRIGLGLESLEPDLPVEQWYRPTTFRGNTSQTLAVLSKPPGCVQVLDEIHHDSMPTIPPDLSLAVPLASLDWIDPGAPFPRDRLVALFGPEPEPGWCYYFEAAEAARQVGDWQTVAALGEAGLASGDEPNDASEWLPFIEAHLRLGNLDRAIDLTDDSLGRNQAVVRMLCRTWGRLFTELVDPADQDRAALVIRNLGCEGSE